jgi:hypothetical protein
MPQADKIMVRDNSKIGYLKERDMLLDISNGVDGLNQLVCTIVHREKSP